MDNRDTVAGGIRYLGERDAQVADLIEVGVGVDLLVHIRADTADVAHFMKDGTELHREEQECQT